MKYKIDVLKYELGEETDMKVQVLVAAMNQMDYSLLDKMNIQTDVIVGNQCDRNEINHIDYKGHEAVYLNFKETGVGLNRNNALMRADADICLFADDDMIYVDGYKDIVIQEFKRHSDADVILFNLQEKNPTRYVITKSHRVGYLNYLRYGTARIAFRLKSIKENAIYFNQCFGGGTEHCHGEDNLFLTSCLKNGLKVYAVPIVIASLTEERESSWDKGYTDSYFEDQGYLYRKISSKFWKILCLQDAIRHKKSYGKSVWKIYNKMTKSGW